MKIEYKKLMPVDRWGRPCPHKYHNRMEPAEDHPKGEEEYIVWGIYEITQDGETNFLCDVYTEDQAVRITNFLNLKP